MNLQLVLCIIIFFLTLISYVLNKIPMWVTAMVSMIVLVITKCLDPSTALSGFSNGNTVLMASMFMVAAGMRRTSFVKWLCNGIMKITKGSFKKAFFGYVVLTMILTNLISSPMVVYAIVAPLVGALCDESGVSRSKVMFPIVVTAIACCQILPTDAAITQASQSNAYLETYEMSQYTMKATDFFLAKWPLFILIPVWAMFLSDKFLPNKDSANKNTEGAKRKEAEALPPLADKLGIIIFFATIICLLISSKLGLASWTIAAAGGMLMVLVGVLTPKEAVNAMPLDMILLFVGSLAMGSALSETGAGDAIGAWLSNAVGGTHNGYVIGALFFIVPFVVTQFMLNRAVMQIFTPICILTCKALGANPIGPILIVTAACLTAFLTPMATPAIPMCMEDGDYDLVDLFKGGWLITIVLAIMYIFYVMTVFPAF